MRDKRTPKDVCGEAGEFKAEPIGKEYTSVYITCTKQFKLEMEL